jgi:hypothetical protein
MKMYLCGFHRSSEVGAPGLQPTIQCELRYKEQLPTNITHAARPVLTCPSIVEDTSIEDFVDDHLRILCCICCLQSNQTNEPCKRSNSVSSWQLLHQQIEGQNEVYLHEQ